MAKEIGFIVLFLVLCLFVNMFLGKKVLFAGLVLVFFSMVMTNLNVIKNDLKEVSSL